MRDIAGFLQTNMGGGLLGGWWGGGTIFPSTPSQQLSSPYLYITRDIKLDTLRQAFSKRHFFEQGSIFSKIFFLNSLIVLA